jgi:UDP-N-acetylmuramoyl-L-alanyl-D-glutamate--2,6-diaminopimelate ligase
MPMPLNQLLTQAQSGELIRELTLDSRNVRPGDLFLAIPGMKVDGRAHIADAIARGAAAIAYEAAGADLQGNAFAVPMIPITGLAQQLSAIAGRFYGEPSRGVCLVGVTGTNGKTSVTHLLAQALDALEQRCGIIGTLGNGFHGQLESSRHTTPDALSVQASLGLLKKAGAHAVAMEVSSHGLHQGRVAALDFKYAVFTNLSRDHLDYHETMEAYGQTKARLFDWPGLRARIINIDDPFGATLAEVKSGPRLLTYSIANTTAAVHCPRADFDDTGVRAYLVTPQGEGLLRSKLLGRFNLSNSLAVVAVLISMNYPLDEILKVMPELQGPAGRMQRIGGGLSPLVVVDYAHTPDALEKVLEALRPHVRGKLHCLFGCGGDRDTGKRPLMAAVAERLSDHVLVTDDNPRSEQPSAIFEDIRAGFVSPEQVQFQHGRAKAITSRIAELSVDDVLLLAGKGHEDYQEIDGVRHPFSDLVEATSALDSWEANHD